jgi:hypothetical protein
MEMQVKTTLTSLLSEWLTSRSPSTTNVREDAEEKGTVRHCW